MVVAVSSVLGLKDIWIYLVVNGSSKRFNHWSWEDDIFTFIVSVRFACNFIIYLFIFVV